MWSRKFTYLMLLLTVSIWGSSYIAGKVVLQAFTPVDMLWIRTLISICILHLIVIHMKLKQPRAHDIPFLLFVGIFGYCGSFLLQTFGMKFASASTSSLINAMNPVATIVIASVALGERITKAKVAAVLLAVGGAYFVLGGAAGRSELLGLCLSLVAMLLWAVVCVLLRKFAGTLHSYVICAWGMTVSAVCLTPFGIAGLFQTNWSLITPKVILCLLYLAFFCMALSQSLWNKCLTSVEAGTCTLFYPIQPLVATILGVIFLHEPLTSSLLIGGALIICGILIGILSDSKLHSKTQ